MRTGSISHFAQSDFPNHSHGNAHEWFSTSPPAPGSDDIFSADDREASTLRFVEWEKPEDFQSKLVAVLAKELRLADAEDQRDFNRAMGATSSGGYDYFNATRNGNKGAVEEVENWQILSPLRSMSFGVGNINRQIHEQFRVGFMELASRRYRRIPKPLGPERIVYGGQSHQPQKSPSAVQRQLFLITATTILAR